MSKTPAKVHSIEIDVNVAPDVERLIKDLRDTLQAEVPKRG